MREMRLLCLVLVTGFVLPSLTAQTAASGATSSTDSQYSLQVKVPLVVEDIVVLDHNGNPVRGLKFSDLTVTENGKPVTLKGFEEHGAATVQTVAQPQLPDLGPNVYTNLVVPPTTDTLNVLLLDVLNTPMVDQSVVRKQMLDYLKTLPPGRSVAIFGLNTHLYMLQGFTSDPKVLAAVIEKSQKTIQLSSSLRKPVSYDIPTKTGSDLMAELILGDEAGRKAIAEIRQFESKRDVYQTSDRVAHTLQALNQLSRYLAGFPGRKNLIWFSGSFPLRISSGPAAADFQDDVRKTTDLLARSRVAVYPVDARGLFGCIPPCTLADLEKFSADTNSEHATMVMMAENTGGKAFFDTNGLKEAVEKVVDDGSSYYSFAYTPPDTRYDGSHRRIKVKIDRPGLHLSYRKTYFADDPDKVLRGDKVLPQTALQAAMRFGAPNATQLSFLVQTVLDKTPVDVPTDGTTPDTTLMKPPYRRYNLTYIIDVGDAHFTVDSGGVRHGRFDFAALVYDPDGQLVNKSVRQTDLALPADRYAEILKRGLRVGQTIEAPAKGDYFIRVVNYDLSSDRLGSVEIPTTSVKPTP